jgi:predicted porin
MKICIRSLVAAMALAIPLAAAAQAPVKIYNIVELSGGGATADTKFDNGKQVVSETLPPAGK